MASYELVVRTSAEKELRSVPKGDLRRIVRKVRALAANPTPPGCVRLEGERRYRLRQGDWRILYEIDHEAKTVTVVKIGHRREVYR
jgi:mRNA interferase RelE/StbE